jgi:hypothetical protein
MGFDLGAETYDASAHGIAGFMLDITQGAPGPPAPATLRVNIAMPTTQGEPHFTTIALPSLDQRLMFDEVQQGTWVMVPTELRPEAIEGIDVDVYANNQAPKAYDFCVSNLRVVCPGECIP